MFEENHKLTAEEIQDYNKQGYSLDEKKTYIIKFLFNDKWNNAADPRPFRIKTSLVEKLAKDSIDMPYVAKPTDNSKHIRGTDEGKPDTAQSILEIQAKYSIGMIKVPIIKPNNNVYGIIEIWPEWVDHLDELPNFTSPTVLPLKEDEDGIEDAQFLNINAVDSPGYPEALSGIHGVCKNGIKECIAELAPLGAAGQLKTARANHSTFLNNLHSLKRNMDGEPPKDNSASAPTLESVVADVEAVKTDVASIKSEVMSQKTILEDIASKLNADTSSTDTPPMGAAGQKQDFVIPKELKDNAFVKELVGKVKESQKTVQEIQKDIQAEKERKAQALRVSQATSIVEKLILLKRIEEDKKDAEIKKYADLKNEDGSLKDLEILDNFLKSTISSESETPLGAAGYTIPGIGSDKTTTCSNEEGLEMLNR